MRTDRPLTPEYVEIGVGGGIHSPTSAEGRPLVVDLDDVLQHPLSIDLALAEIAAQPSAVIGILAAMLRGKTSLRQRLARSEHFEPARLLYNTETTASLLRARAAGRPVYLVSATYERPIIDQVARFLGVLAGWSASDDANSACSFAQSLGAQGFEHFAPNAAATRLARGHSVAQAGWRSWAKLFRVHQYAKNALVLVPLLTAHQFAMLAAAKALLACAAFSLCASSAYILNDLVDVTADRAHPSKHTRPLASGAIAPAPAVVAMLALLAGAFGIASAVSSMFFVVLLGYLALTTVYSFWLKRVMLADVVALAALYTIRVIAGSVAIDVVMSEWLFAFSLFIFMSLAMVKRYVEMAAQPDDNAVLPNRDYHASDRAMVAMLAAAAGYSAIVVFALYISSDAVRALYTHPQVLWIACPVLIYWVGRVLMLAHRRMIDDDPVIFALKDRVSWFSMAAICALMLIAM